MARKRRGSLFRPPKNVARTLLEDVQGSPSEKLALFKKLKAAGRFEGIPAEELKAIETLLSAFAGREGGDGD